MENEFTDKIDGVLQSIYDVCIEYGYSVEIKQDQDKKITYGITDQVGRIGAFYISIIPQKPIYDVIRYGARKVTQRRITLYWKLYSNIDTWQFWTCFIIL
jgi:hypothetical protein